MLDLYEKYGFSKIDELKNYGGDIDNILRRKYYNYAIIKNKELRKLRVDSGKWRVKEGVVA